MGVDALRLEIKTTSKPKRAGQRQPTDCVASIAQMISHGAALHLRKQVCLERILLQNREFFKNYDNFGKLLNK